MWYSNGPGYSWNCHRKSPPQNSRPFAVSSDGISTCTTCPAMTLLSSVDVESILCQFDGSDMRQHAGQRQGHTREVQHLRQYCRGSALPASRGTDEASKLLLRGPPAPGRLLLERAERTEFAEGLDGPF